MSKKKTVFFCSECGNEAPRWQGQCPACGAWNCMVEEQVTRGAQGRRQARGGARKRKGAGYAKPVSLDEIDEKEYPRMRTGLDEFDFVLGGGVVPGSVVLLGGEPGIGKSTILTQVAARLNSAGYPTLYISGEESLQQVKLRAGRIGNGAGKVAFLAETEIGELVRQAAEFGPRVLIADSIQTLYAEEIDGAPGNISQVRECAARIQRFAKDEDVAVFIVGHVTKGGHLAGPRVLEHIVDTTIYFEHTGNLEHRIMRATKNRFGSVDEIGVFRMTTQGLEPVKNPSEIFLADRNVMASGSAVTALIEGTRPVLVEIQGLIGPAAYGSPQRVATGYSRKRLAILLAVLEKRLGLPFSQFDVFVNVVGGVKLNEPAADAAIVAALVSSALDRTLPQDAIFLGEVGLGGEIRRASQAERRIAEAAQMGFKQVFLAKGSVPRKMPAGLNVVGIDDIKQLIQGAVGNIELSAKAKGRVISAPPRKAKAEPRAGTDGRRHRTTLQL